MAIDLKKFKTPVYRDHPTVVVLSAESWFALSHQALNWLKDHGYPAFTRIGEEFAPKDSPYLVQIRGDNFRLCNPDRTDPLLVECIKEVGSYAAHADREDGGHFVLETIPAGYDFLIGYHDEFGNEWISFVFPVPRPSFYRTRKILSALWNICKRGEN